MELSAIADLVDALSTETETGARTYQAVVSRIDNDGTVWVNLAGSNMATPTASTSSEIEPNDDVTVEWRNNKLYIVGNTSNPSAGSLRVDAVEQATNQARTAAQSALENAGIARQAAESAQADAESARDAAESAQNSLKSVVQGATTVEKAVSVMQTALEAVVEYDPTNDTVQEYFWHDANGAHVLGDTSGYRNDIDSTGMKIIDISAEESVAEFGADGATIGKSDGTQSYLYEDYHSLQLIDKEGRTYFWVSDLRDKEGKVTEYFIGDGVTTEFNLIRAADSYAHRDVTITIDGVETTDWNVSVQTFVFNTAPADGAVIAIKYLPISTYLKGYSLGIRKEYSTVGGYSVVEGDDNVASGYASHAEGRSTEASGDESHAEGWGSIASGDRSHAEGRSTEASGEYSHAQNQGTKALSDAQTTLGKYNIADANDTYAVIIGNGSSNSSRSNALSVDWDGNIQMAIDTTAVSGDDFDLYTAISDLGWESDIIV